MSPELLPVVRPLPLAFIAGAAGLALAVLTFALGVGLAGAFLL